METFIKLFFKLKDEIFNITLFNLDNIIYYLSVVPAVLCFELIFVGWKKSSIKKLINFNQSARTDTIVFFLQIFGLFNLISVIFTFGIFHVLYAAVYKITNLRLLYTIENIYLQIFILYIVVDFIKYISHAFFHKFKTFWIIHEFHHSAEEFCILTRYRDHFLEGAIKKIFFVFPFAIFGSVESFLIIAVLTEFHKLIIHSAIKSDWGWLGRYIIVSPAAHRIHHSINPKHYGKNFAVSFIFWDRLFGTYHECESIDEFGVPGGKFNKDGIVKDFLMVIINFIRAVKINLKRAFINS